jgi:glycine C-acetyltransferase
MQRVLADEISALDREGRRKGEETVIAAVLPAEGGRGPRVLIEGQGDRPFLRMNSNGYLGMARAPEVVAAEEETVREFGAGPGAVRFISGTFRSHIALERRLAAFHRRDAAMIFSSAYAAMLGVLPLLIGPKTAVISDSLNHSCIINAIRLGRPAHKQVYPHLDVAALSRALEACAGRFKRALVVTDGVFSMRGDHAPLDEIVDVARTFDERFSENVCVVVDDSHGVGAMGATGRGTEEVTGERADVLVATLGKAFGVNGGYVCGTEVLVDYLREKSPFYVYSNPITPGEAAAAARAVDIVDSDAGRGRLDHLRRMTRRFQTGLAKLGYETLPGEHPIVPVLVRDTRRCAELVRHLAGHGVLATGLGFPVVPKGEEEIRFQLSADHTEADVDEALAALASFRDPDSRAAAP